MTVLVTDTVLCGPAWPRTQTHWQGHKDGSQALGWQAEVGPASWTKWHHTSKTLVSAQTPEGA